MLHVFRESIGRYVAIAILGLIALTFVFFGIDFSVTQLSFAARVNGETISVPEFDRQLRAEQNRIQSLILDELDDDMRREIRRSVIDGLVFREVMAQQAVDAGYRISDSRMQEIMQSQAAFQVGGRFSQDVYLSLLTSEGLTPAGYEAQQREASTIGELQLGLTNSSFITPAEFRRRIELLYERREVAYALFAANDFLTDVAVSEDEIAEYYAGNSGRFMTEESVDIEYLELNLARIAETVEVSEEELLEYYESESELYSVSEERRVSHILIEPEGDDYVEAEVEADAILARLNAGESFAELAAEVSDDVGTRNSGGDLGWLARGVFAGPFEDELFAMDVGEIRGPVETEFGFHILRLEELRAGEQLPFEAVRDELRTELASDQAYSTFIDMANDLANDAYDARDELQSVAESYGLEVQTIAGLTRTSDTGQFVNPAPIIAAAFDDRAIATGENSDIIDVSDERVVVLRVAAHNLPTARQLDEVSEDIRAILEQEKAADLASEAASNFYDLLDTDESDNLLAMAETSSADAGASWNPPTWVERDSTGVPAGIVSLVFSQSNPVVGQPSILRTPVGNGDQAVVLLIRVEPGRPEDVPEVEREEGQQQLTQVEAEIEFNVYASDALSRATVRIPDEVLDPQL